MMEIPISFPVDRDGFLRRECPHCGKQFKWHNGPANAEAEEHPPPPAYHCPMCGQPAAHDSWWTQEQIAYAEAQAAPSVAQFIEESVDELFKGFKNNQYVRLERSGHADIPDAPAPLVETDDGRIVTSPCHSYEPVKIPDDYAGTIHCLICGAAFAL